MGDAINVHYNRRRRSPNWTEKDANILVKIYASYHTSITAPLAQVSWESKRLLWFEMQTKFNKFDVDEPRDVKSVYDKIKNCKDTLRKLQRDGRLVVPLSDPDIPSYIRQMFYLIYNVQFNGDNPDIESSDSLNDTINNMSNNVDSIDSKSDIICLSPDSEPIATSDVSHTNIQPTPDTISCVQSSYPTNNQNNTFLNHASPHITDSNDNDDSFCPFPQTSCTAILNTSTSTLATTPIIKSSFSANSTNNVLPNTNNSSFLKLMRSRNAIKRPQHYIPKQLRITAKCSKLDTPTDNLQQNLTHAQWMLAMENRQLIKEQREMLKLQKQYYSLKINKMLQETNVVSESVTDK